MSLESYSKFAGAVSLIGLLSFTLGLAQQEQANQMPTLFIGADAPHQLEGSHRPGVNPGASPVKQAATPSDEASERMAKASEPTRAPAAPEPQLIASLTRAKVSKPTPLDKAYLDAFSILREDGACSRFYGGPQVIEVLNKLTLQLKPIFLDRTIALRMKGKISVATNYASGLSYRLFEKAELNLDGPFYAATVLPNGPRVLGIGRFFPNTREARVTILLHELGHMIKKGDKWVLPDDGNDTSLSQENTARVISVCGEQIKGLGKTSFAQELLNVRTRVKPGPVSGEIALDKNPPLAQ